MQALMIRYLFSVFAHSMKSSLPSSRFLTVWCRAKIRQCSFFGIRLPVPLHDGQKFSRAVMIASLMNSERLGMFVMISSRSALTLKVIIPFSFSWIRSCDKAEINNLVKSQGTHIARERIVDDRSPRISRLSIAAVMQSPFKVIVASSHLYFPSLSFLNIINTCHH